MKIFEILTEKGWVLTSTIYSLIAALNASIAINISSGLYKDISIYAFMLGLCVIILQLVISNYFIKKTGNSSHEVVSIIKECINRNENLLLPKDCISLSSEIWELVQAKEIAHIVIICYGTSGFDGIIPKLHSEKLPISTDVMVCSPNSDKILFPKDKDKIIELIDTYSSENIKFTESPVPSTLRACILYDKNEKPIWSSIQTYYYNYEIKNHSFDYRNSFTVISRKGSSDILLREMEIIIKKEFYRLKDFDLRKMGLNTHQINAVRYVEKKGTITPNLYKKINCISSIEDANHELDELVENYKKFSKHIKSKSPYYELA